MTTRRTPSQFADFVSNFMHEMDTYVTSQHMAIVHEQIVKIQLQYVLDLPCMIDPDTGDYVELGGEG